MPDDSKGKHIPERMCVICRRRFPKNMLARYVRSASGEMRLDLRKREPGRGWYCCGEAECQKKFAKYRPRARKRSQGDA